jgi:hypothetical protein
LSGFLEWRRGGVASFHWQNLIILFQLLYRSLNHEQELPMLLDPENFNSVLIKLWLFQFLL